MEIFHQNTVWNCKYLNDNFERANQRKLWQKIEGEIKSLTGRLGNKGFVAKAPAEVVEGAKSALAEAEKQADLIRQRLAML